MSTPSARAYVLGGRRQVSWLPGLPSRAFPDRVAVQWRAVAAATACGRRPRSQWRVRAGFAPASLHHRPLNGGSVALAAAMTVNLTRIYTKLGDGGETHLGDMSRVPKTHPRIEAYGDVDELNAQLGVDAHPRRTCPQPYAAWLRRIQNDLFDVGADLAVAARRRPRAPARDRRPDRRGWRAPATRSTTTLAPLKSFVLPGGTPAAAHLHVCRTVCRRAERRALLVEDCNPEVVRYLNRLSDLLFILSRGANAGDEPLWEPGRSQG